jgi:putative ABC transport system permease protein
VIGKRFQFHEPPGKPRPYYEIVGLVGNFKFQDMHEDYLPFTVLSLPQMDKVETNGQIVIQSSLPLTTLMPSIKQAIAEVNPAINLEFKIFKTQVHESLLQDELMATLSGFFGALAALLAAIGLYGVISYMVVQRTKEIGVRMAIGANRGNVIAMILREAGVLTAVGLVIGTALALASAQAAKSLLFGLKPRDPLTLVLSIFTLAAVAAFASFLPAYRASRLDPVKALRYD